MNKEIYKCSSCAIPPECHTVSNHRFSLKKNALKIDRFADLHAHAISN